MLAHVSRAACTIRGPGGEEGPGRADNKCPVWTSGSPQPALWSLPAHSGHKPTILCQTWFLSLSLSLWSVFFPGESHGSCFHVGLSWSPRCSPVVASPEAQQVPFQVCLCSPKTMTLGQRWSSHSCRCLEVPGTQ